MDPDLKKMIIDDPDRFVRRKEFYPRVGKAWKRGYLLYGKSSLIAAMANYLNFHIYDLDLTDIAVITIHQQKQKLQPTKMPILKVFSYPPHHCRVLSICGILSALVFVWAIANQLVFLQIEKLSRWNAHPAQSVYVNENSD